METVICYGIFKVSFKNLVKHLISPRCYRSKMAKVVFVSKSKHTNFNSYFIKALRTTDCVHTS